MGWLVLVVFLCLHFKFIVILFLLLILLLRFRLRFWLFFLLLLFILFVIFSLLLPFKFALSPRESFVHLLYPFRHFCDLFLIDSGFEAFLDHLCILCAFVYQRLCPAFRYVFCPRSFHTLVELSFKRNFHRLIRDFNSFVLLPYFIVFLTMLLDLVEVNWPPHFSHFGQFSFLFLQRRQLHSVVEILFHLLV